MLNNSFKISTRQEHRALLEKHQALREEHNVLREVLRREHDALCEGHNVSQGLVNQLQVKVADVSNILLPPNSCSIAESVSRPLYQRLTVNNGLYSKHSFARGYQGEILQCSPRTSLCKRTRHDANVKHLTSGSLRMMLDANHDIRKLDNDAARKASNADIAAAIYSSSLMKTVNIFLRTTTMHVASVQYRHLYQMTCSVIEYTITYTLESIQYHWLNWANLDST